MKTRSDFVSNSSSSSFILKDVGFFAYFGISKQDIDDALTDLCGGREVLAKRLNDAIAECEEALAKAKIEAGLSTTASDNLKFELEYRSDRLRELKTKGLGIWCIYDMTDGKDRRACFREWNDHFTSWFAPNEGEYEIWNSLVDTLRFKCDFDNIEEIADDPRKELIESVYDRKTRRYRNMPIAGGAKLIRYIKKKLAVKTMKEVLHDKDCSLMIHFGDNYIYEIGGMTEPGVADADENDASVENRRYESKAYSAERFFEILIGYFVEKGRIDLSDPELLDYWKIPEDDDWYRKNHPGRKYYLEENKATWADVYDDMLNCNAVMHEG